MMGKSLKVNDFGGQWPQFCDHSVTSADVRLIVGISQHDDIAPLALGRWKFPAAGTRP